MTDIPPNTFNNRSLMIWAMVVITTSAPGAYVSLRQQGGQPSYSKAPASETQHWEEKPTGTSKVAVMPATQPIAVPRSKAPQQPAPPKPESRPGPEPEPVKTAERLSEPDATAYLADEPADDGEPAVSASP